MGPVIPTSQWTECLTDASENITFQHPLRVLTMRSSNMLHILHNYRPCSEGYVFTGVCH